jgi:hypothetical protein
MNQGLFTAIARLRNFRSTPAAGLALIEGVARGRGNQADAAQLLAALAAVEVYGEGIEAAVSGTPIAAQGRLRDLGGLIFVETWLALLVNPIGKAALEAAIKEVRAQVDAERAAVDARAAAEAEPARRAQDAQLAAEAAAMHPVQLLNDLRAVGVTLEANADGAITIQPAGKLSPVQRRVIDSRRDEVVSLLRAAQQTDTL